MSKIYCDLIFTSVGISGAEKNLLSLKSEPRIVFSKVSICGMFAPKENALFLSEQFSGGTLTSLYHFLCRKGDGTKTILYAIGVKALAYCLLRRVFNSDVKIIFGLRWSLQNNWRDRILRLIMKTFEAKIECIISNSLFALNGVQNEIKKVSIHNGIDVQSADVKTNFNFRGRLCYVGTITERKRIFELIKAMDQASMFSKYTLNLFGLGDQLTVVRNYVAARNLSEYITFEGYVPNVTSHLKNFDLLLLPSLKGEGCPTVLLEARALKIPTIYYESEGIAEQQINGVTGIGLGDPSIHGMIAILQDYSALNIKLMTIHRNLLADEMEHTRDRFQKLHIQAIKNV